MRDDSWSRIDPMRLPAFVLLALISLCPAIAAAQATLNKCVDAKGGITYTNKPCSNAREAHKVEIDPAPQPDQPRIAPVPVQPAKPAAIKPAPNPAPAPQASTRLCNTLSDKLGNVIDKMDQARRKGYTQDQMDKWNEEVRELERKKQQSGCF